MTRLEYWKRRATLAEREIAYQEKRNEDTRLWAVEAFNGQRRLADRCTYLYGLAVHLGATEDQLRKGWPNNEARPA